MKNILLTGRPGCGKTTLVKKIIEKLPGMKKQGFYTTETRDNNVRTGFKVITLDGQQAVLADIGIKSQYNVGKYKVDVEALEDLAANALIKAKGQADLIVIDEIGKMELFSELMKLSIAEALDSKKKVLATVGEIENEFVDEINGREDVALFKVTLQNRDELVDKIVKELS